MDLLPKSRSEFTSKEYWDKFFQKRGPKSFEWYGEYNDLCGILHKYIKQPDRVLIVGCGNSRLSADLYDVGYKNTVSIDISETVITQMKGQNIKPRPELSFVCMDVTKLDYEDNSFSVVLDKGTLDALMPDTETITMETVHRMFGEIGRVLRLGGRYMCITLAQPHLIQKTTEYFSELGWMVRVCRVPDSSDEDSDFHLPVFVCVFTKFKKMPGMKQIVEISSFEDSVERLNGIDELLTAIQGIQQYGMIRQQLGAKTHTDENIALDLYSPVSSSPRYTLHVVDRRKRSKNKFAIFIVPEGRETEWMFVTPAGRASLSDSAGFERLLVVLLNRDHEYRDGLEGVKAELSTKVMELAPPGLKGQQVPFLSIGEEINTRSICHRGNSTLSGDFVIEDVDLDDASYRRLIFASNPSIIQSETRLIKGKVKGDPKPDPHYLSFGYYSEMVAGLCMLDNFTQTMGQPVDVLLVGLGGGCLAKFLHDHFTNVHLSVVELDPDVVRVAKDWFGLTESDRLKVTVADGLEYIRGLSDTEKKPDVLILDVDNKDLGQGISCPPKPFVDVEFLKVVHSVLDPKGVFILNMVCRNKSLKESIISDIKSVFGCLYCQPIPRDINEILFALPNDRNSTIALKSDGGLPKELLQAKKSLQESVISKYKYKPKRGDNVVDLTKALDNLNIL